MATAVAVFTLPALLPGCAAATSSSTPSRAGCRARGNALIDAFWDVVYAGMMALVAGVPDRSARCEHYRSGQHHHGAAACRLAGDRALRRARRRARARGAARRRCGCCAGGAHERRRASPPSALRAMLVLIALRMPVGLSMLVVGAVGYVYLSSWPAVPRLHEDQPLLPVRQLHAVGHPAVHPDGRAGRAVGPVDRACSAPPRRSSGACAAGSPWP